MSKNITHKDKNRAQLTKNKRKSMEDMETVRASPQRNEGPK